VAGRVPRPGRGRVLTEDPDGLETYDVEVNGIKTTLRLNKADAQRLGVKQAAPAEKPAEEPVTDTPAEEPKEPAEPPPAEEPKEPAPPKGTKAKNVTAVANKARRPDDVGTK
jgi:hypothetical protein